MSMDARLRALVAAVAADVKALKARPVGGGGVPTTVTSRYTVPTATQALYRIPPRVDGLLVVDGGILMEV